jgi:hypothetical protein
MKQKPAMPPAFTWYEKIWNQCGLVNTNPELTPYLDVDQFPQYQANLVGKLVGQGMPLTPLKELKTMTPEKLGLVLGQQCASAYALGESLQALVDPNKLEQAGKFVKNLAKQKHLPGVTSALHAVGVSGMMLTEFLKDFPRFEKLVHKAFKAALDQPNYQEAVEFFRGYAKGLTQPGLKNGQLARRTEATTLQSKMFMHAEEIAKMKSVKELRTFLLQNGMTKQTLGDDERLQKFCQRLGFSPGKRGRPPKSKK